MSEYNNEATSTNFSFRRFLIIAILPIMFVLFFNGVEVELVSNDHADFHQYSENSVSPGTSYYDDGAVQPFASAWNSLAKNIARMLGYTHLISDNTNTTNSYIATLYTYLSNNLPGQWATLTDIKTASTNSAASISALLTLIGDQVNINWTDISSFQGVTTSYGGEFLSNIGNRRNWEVSDLYWYFNNFNVASQNFFRVILPTRAGVQNYLNNYIDYIDIIGSNGQPIQAEYTLEYDYTSNRLIIYFLNYVPFVQSYPFIVHIHYNHSIDYFVNQDHKISYLPYDTTDYIKKSNNIYLRELLKKDPNIEVNIDDSINSTNIELDVSIGINDFQEVNTISNKLRTWLSTGVGVSALIAALDQLDDSFFTLHNRSVIETINNQYTDFYD